MSMLSEVPAERGMTVVSPEAIVIVSLEVTRLLGPPLPRVSISGALPLADVRRIWRTPAGLPSSTR